MVSRIGIIGGSGLENPAILQDFKEKEVDTPFGKPSSSLITGKIGGVEVVIISRHGRKHELTPSGVNYRANIFALKQEKCKQIIATTACGSLKEEIKRGDFVIPDQLIDFTKNRKNTFFEKFEFGPMHAGLADPFSEDLRKKIIAACLELGINFHPLGTLVTIEGPRFSTRAESMMFRSFGADIINMSVATEAALAREAELEYGVIAMATDYDCWKIDEEPVSWEAIKGIMQQNSEKVKKVIIKVIESLGAKEEASKEEEYIKGKIRTIPNWPKKGIMFRDITTLLKDGEGFKKVIDILEKRYKNMDIDLIAGIESRGFIIAAALASRLGKGLIPIRKPGKLPHETIQEEYDLEYGKDKVEIHKDAITHNEKVLITDDLLATGGTMSGACSLVRRLGGKIVECAFVIELPQLGGRKKLFDYKVFSIVKFEGE